MLFIRNENFRSFLRHYPVVSVIVAINLLVFLIVNLIPHYGSLLYSEMVQLNILIRQGDYWRLITPIFLHVQLMHVLFNSFWIVIFAPALERILGKVKLIVLYLATGVIGNIATYYLLGLNTFSLGASGAVFGLFGIYIYMVLFRKDLIDGPSTSIVIWIVVFSVITTFLTPNVNILAHLFGLIGGLLLAPPMLAGVPLNFSWQPTVVRPRSHYEDTEVTFNPNRWKKRRMNRNVTKNIVLGVVVLLVILGIISTFVR